MYFKLVLACVGFMCLGIASGKYSYKCWECYGMYDHDPKAVDDCRHFVNVTETSTCAEGGMCVFYYGKVKRNGQAVVRTGRMCSLSSCYSNSGWNAENIYCSECTGNYCNSDKY
ncbi:hypothetical protein PPYR_01450 [Photinus pyralis]|uniref:Protein quiver n=1 Tax=Photinus pyralis TaxID=7054 RepID=A0A5N4B540_PHOPY|nr:uncharacterized protein LOC116160683 [Photinus pyralis]KAB0804480.1 hypothetical protein PPYR_01450 [Photinus pyralis]